MQPIKIYELTAGNLDSIAQSYFNNEIIMVFQIFPDFSADETDLFEPEERECFSRYRSNYFKGRCIISRIAIKKIFSYIFREASSTGIRLTKCPEGRILVNGRRDIFLSVSYTNNLISISIAQQKIGSDIEYIREFSSEFLCRTPVYRALKRQWHPKEPVDEMLVMWTFIEAISKYDGCSIPALLNTSYDISSVEVHTHVINGKYLFTLVTDSKKGTQEPPE